MIEYMFEESETAARSLVDRICGSSRDENRAAAQKLVSVGDLYLLRQREFGDCAAWSTDTTEAVTAEVAAALRISQGLAASHLYYARAMREKLPQVATVFVAGDIDYLMYQTLVYRTALITDAEVLTSVDAELAVKVPRWPSLSRGQISGRVDRIVARHDRDAVRRRKERAADRAVDIWDSGAGLAEIRGFLGARTAGRWISGSTRWRPASATPIRAPGCSVAPTLWVHWQPGPSGWPANADGLIAPPGESGKPCGHSCDRRPRHR